MKGATLFDLALRDTYAKRPYVKPELRERLLRSRKFVLSESMSSYLADMSCAPFASIVDPLVPPITSVTERLRTRSVELIEAARHLARAPHEVTWIEYDSLARRRRSRTEYRHFIGTSSGTYEEDDSNICPRVGWLIEQHASIPTAFRLIQISELTDGQAVMMPFAMTWCTDDVSVLPWRNLPFAPGTESAATIGTGISVYNTDQIGLCFAPGYDEKFSGRVMSDMVRESVGELRALFFFLATLNDIPTTYDHVRPSKGYVAKGMYRRFSEHTVITLNVPAHRSLKTLAARALTTLRKRAHHVRGFWRNDWRHPPATQCEHVWEGDEHSVRCTHCSGRKIWITEHVRGDASLGFVLHDYAVNKQES